MRQQAEHILRGEAVDLAALAPDEVERLVHELHALHAQLERQNDALRATQRELALSRDKYSDLYDFAPVGYISVDDTYRVLEANLTSLAMLNLRRDQLVGQPLTDFVAAEDRERVEERQRKLFNDRSPQVYEVQLVRPDGSYLYAQMVAIYTYQPNSDAVQCRITISDISARRHAELALQEAYRGLEWRVEERTAALARAIEALSLEVEERRRAEEAEREQRVLAEALADTAAALNSTLELDEVLERILANVGRVIPHDAANIMLVERHEVFVVRSHGYEKFGAEEAIRSYRRPLKEVTHLAQMAAAQAPLVISYTRRSAYRRYMPMFAWVRSYAGAPIIIEDKVTGFLNLVSTRPGFFDSSHTERLKAFVDQAATAIRNAHLYSHGQTLATLQERQRLARELHDAVSQTLWSASLIADILPDLWEQDAQRARERLAMLSRLTRGALFEMRTLLLEMLPSALVEVGLGEALYRLVEATASRSELKVDLVVRGAHDLPPEVQLAMYRATQEALNNMIRHSSATEAEIILHFARDRVNLRIRDDGQGFNPERIPAGHLGLKIMRERIDKTGGRLRVKARPGKGTEISITWVYDEDTLKNRET